MSYFPSKLMAAVVTVIAVGAKATAQTASPVVFKRNVEVSRPEVINPKSFVPQIDTFVHSHAHASENPLVRRKFSPVPNSLPVGSIDQSVSRSDAKILFPGINFTGYYPPDCDMGVSPNWVVLAVNTQIAFYKKSTGVKTFQQDYAKFLNGNAAHVISDPKVFFDHLSKRWFTLIIDADFTGKTSTMLIGVSDTEDPNGTWKKYAVDSELKVGSDEFWLDYPGFGVNKDTVVFTGNMFGYTSGYAGNEFMVMPKQALLTGGTFTAKQFQDADAGTVKVAINADPTSDKVYCVSFDNTTQLKVHAIQGGANAAPTVTSTFVTIPTALYPSAPLIGPGGQIDGFGDARLFTANYRNGSLVTAHSVQVSASDTRQMVRWYQVSLNNWPSGSELPKLSNVGNVIGGPGENYHMPAVNQNARGDIALAFTKTTSSTSADLLYTAHKKSDRYGTMSKPVTVATSTGAYRLGRWGDYFAVSVDPTDSKTFWGYGMIGRADGYWSTVVSSLKVSYAGDNAVGYAPTAASVITGTQSGGTVASLAAADSDSYNVTSVPVAAVGQVTGAEFTYKTKVTKLTTDYIAFSAKLSAPATSTVFVYLWNYTTGKYDLAGSVPGATASAGTLKYEFAESAAPTYTNSTGDVKFLVRVVQPIRGGMPSAFVFKADQIQALAGTIVN
jgi:hypothetical protein